MKRKEMKSDSLITMNEPQSLVAESYKIFRTNLNYLNIDKVNQVVMFTSAVADEGKTTTIVNTAISFAQGGKKVLLLECDLRKSRLHKIFTLTQLLGLTNILAESLCLEDVVQTIPEYDNLHIITSGPQPPDPAEMLASNAFERLIAEARELYDIILIDAPPVLAITDASVISRVADGVVIIIAANQTKKDEVRKAKRALENVGAKVLGALLCKADIKKHGYYYYYGDKSK